MEIHEQHEPRKVHIATSPWQKGIVVEDAPLLHLSLLESRTNELKWHQTSSLLSPCIFFFILLFALFSFLPTISFDPLGEPKMRAGHVQLLSRIKQVIKWIDYHGATQLGSDWHGFKANNLLSSNYAPCPKPDLHARAFSSARNSTASTNMSIEKTPDASAFSFPPGRCLPLHLPEKGNFGRTGCLFPFIPRVSCFRLQPCCPEAVNSAPTSSSKGSASSSLVLKVEKGSPYSHN